MSVLIARGAGVRRRRRRDPWLFRDLDVTVEPGDLVALIGPPGSGRTTLLLALARRFRLTAGRVTIEGRASLGYVPEVATPEPVFTVTEHVRERLALLGRSRAEATGVPLRGLVPDRLGQDLSPYEKQVLGLVLAELASPSVIALDGWDDGLDARERADLWQLITEVAARGVAVIVTAREADPDAFTTVIELSTDDARSPGSPGGRLEPAAGGEEVEGRESAGPAAEGDDLAVTGDPGPAGPAAEGEGLAAEDGVRSEQPGAEDDGLAAKDGAGSEGAEGDGPVVAGNTGAEGRPAGGDGKDVNGGEGR